MDFIDFYDQASNVLHEKTLMVDSLCPISFMSQAYRNPIDDDHLESNTLPEREFQQGTPQSASFTKIDVFFHYRWS